MIARWQDLCLDAVDVGLMSTFWGAVAGLEVVGPLEHRRLEGPTPRHTIWINAVDRPHTVKNRLHLDVDCGSLDDLLALGATVLQSDTGLGWTVMADPEGGELCAFVRESAPAYRLHGIGIDCVDAAAQAVWWGEVFGVDPVAGEVAGDHWYYLEGVAADDRMTLDFAAVPEPRVGLNRVHWDVVGTVDDFLARGATHLWDQPSWTVLADPEGNEFCVFPPG